MLGKLDILRLPAKGILAELFRYTLVGGLAFAADFGTLFLLSSKLHVHYLVAAEIAFLLGLGVNYALSTSWVFHSRAQTNQWLEFFVFAAIGLIGLGLNGFIIWFMTEVVSLHYLGSKIVATGIVFFFNFFVRKFTLFPTLEGK